MKTYLFNNITDETITKECVIDNTMYQTLEDAVIQLELIYNSPEFDDESNEIEYYIESYTLEIND